MKKGRKSKKNQIVEYSEDEDIGREKKPKKTSNSRVQRGRKRRGWG